MNHLKSNEIHNNFPTSDHQLSKIFWFPTLLNMMIINSESWLRAKKI